MITVEEARKAVLAPVARLEPERVPLTDALGRVLATEAASDMDIAPFDNSAMDGYAVRAQDVAESCGQYPATLGVVEHIPAGSVPTRAVAPGEASRIMTGAPMPEGADAVVMVEYTEPGEEDGGSGGTVLIKHKAKPGEHVRRAGEDVREGGLVLEAGETVDSAAVGLLAATGHAEVDVFRRPRVAIVSTGDELVEIAERPGPGQIRNSNAWSLSAQVLEAGGVPVRLDIVRDDETDTRATLVRAAEFDAMISTGGVSMGDFDVVRDVLEEVGDVSFWKVAMRPGSPLTYGTIGGTPFFGLPGNPTSSMVSFELFARPALRKMQGFDELLRTTATARLAHDVRKKPHRHYFLRGRLEADGAGVYSVALAGSQSSALLTSMHQADCLVSLPEGEEEFAEGTEVTVVRLDVQEGTP